MDASIILPCTNCLPEIFYKHQLFIPPELQEEAHTNDPFEHGTQLPSTNHLLVKARAPLIEVRIHAAYVNLMIRQLLEFAMYFFLFSLDCLVGILIPWSLFWNPLPFMHLMRFINSSTPS